MSVWKIGKIYPYPVRGLRLHHSRSVLQIIRTTTTDPTRSDRGYYLHAHSSVKQTTSEPFSASSSPRTKVTGDVMLCVRNLSAGGENDDRSGDDFRHMLAAVSHILHCHLSHAGTDYGAVHSRRVLGVLLASDVQFHAQPNRLLLDELKVSDAEFFFHFFFFFLIILPTSSVVSRFSDAVLFRLCRYPRAVETRTRYWSLDPLGKSVCYTRPTPPPIGWGGPVGLIDWTCYRCISTNEHFY